MFLHFIVGDIKNQSKGMKPTKNKKKEDKDMAAMPSGEIKGEEDKEDDQSINVPGQYEQESEEEEEEESDEEEEEEQ